MLPITLVAATSAPARSPPAAAARAAVGIVRAAPLAIPRPGIGETINSAARPRPAPTVSRLSIPVASAAARPMSRPAPVVLSPRWIRWGMASLSVRSVSAASLAPTATSTGADSIRPAYIAGASIIPPSGDSRGVSSSVPIRRASACRGELRVRLGSSPARLRGSRLPVSMSRLRFWYVVLLTISSSVASGLRIRI
jgi:hypothetical protein